MWLLLGLCFPNCHIRDSLACLLHVGLQDGHMGSWVSSKVSEQQKTKRSFQNLLFMYAACLLVKLRVPSMLPGTLQWQQGSQSSSAVSSSQAVPLHSPCILQLGRVERDPHEIVVEGRTPSVPDTGRASVPAGHGPRLFQLSCSVSIRVSAFSSQQWDAPVLPPNLCGLEDRG